MTRGVYLFGAVMVVLGLTFISMGVPIVRLEIGWTEIIGGSVAASAGCIVLVMGVFLARLDDLQRVLERVAPPATLDAEHPTIAAIADPAPIEAPAFTEAHPLAPASLARRHAPAFEVYPEPALQASLHADASPAELTPVEATTAPTLPESAPELVAEEEEALQSPAIPTVDAPVAAPKRRQSFLSGLFARRRSFARRRPEPPAPAPVAEPLLAEPDAPSAPTQRTPIDLSSGWDMDEPDIFAPRREEPVRSEAPEPEPAPPVLHAPPLHHEPPHHAPEPEHVAEDLPLHEDEPEPEPEPVHPEPVGEASPVVHAPSVVAPAPPTPKAEPNPLEPVVVGRYNAGSASYVMYSNGMIEVETEQGTHQFASMQELKAFIERRDARVS